MVHIGNDWDDALSSVFLGETYQTLRAFLKEEYRTKTVYPPMHDIFNALKTTPLQNARVVVLGQDPYHNAGEAHGMSFSVQKGVKVPPSLRNIYKELASDLGCQIPNNGYLMPWAEQGVLLLNTILTVREHTPLSHKNKGWEVVTNQVISCLGAREEPLVFLLWGRGAGEKKSLITNKNHLVLTAPHPSPLSAHYGFLGCKHFSKTNEFLVAHGQTPINWQIPNL